VRGAHSGHDDNNDRYGPEHDGGEHDDSRGCHHDGGWQRDDQRGGGRDHFTVVACGGGRSPADLWCRRATGGPGLLVLATGAGLITVGRRRGVA
jgi:hypothetical protein